MATECLKNCDDDLEQVRFDDCEPIVLPSEIRRFFMAKRVAPDFADWTTSTEWIARMNNSSQNGDDYIRVLTCIGDRPAGSPVIKEISNGRKITIRRDNTINITIDDCSIENHGFIQSLQCGGRFKVWYEIMGGEMFGGNGGILINIDADMVLARGTDGVMQYNITGTWQNIQMEDRCKSPIFDLGPGSDEEVAYDTIMTFVNDVNESAYGVDVTAAATDAQLQFQFNSVSPHIGTDMTMIVKLSTVTELTVDFKSDYAGTAFKYVDTAGGNHTGVFTNGTVTF